MRLSLTAAALVLTAGCVKDIPSEERLDRETEPRPLREMPDATELAKINCLDSQAGLAAARNESKPETDRVLGYLDLYESLRKRADLLEEAMSRNPDLQYQAGSQELVAAKELCIQQTADARAEFERYVRELVEVPTVQEIKGGSTIIVARMDFNTLRQAIEALKLDDREQLLSRVESAERKVDTGTKKKTK